MIMPMANQPKYWQKVRKTGKMNGKL